MVAAKDEKELQKKYVHLQILKQQASALMEEKQAIDSRVNEVNFTMNAIRKIGEASIGDRMWSPLGSGAFMISDVGDIEKVLVNAGAGVLVKTDREHAIEILEGRLKDLEDVDRQLMDELVKFGGQINSLEGEMQEMLEAEQHSKERKGRHKHGEKVQGTGG
ncbi:MAG: prefoldin subunit alpha [Candidatus Aenigmarchaeota archaeon]|nr:prefoldin subunit alpha [Candidatus Aenigmarchaeota archaeon]